MWNCRPDFALLYSCLRRRLAASLAHLQQRRGGRVAAEHGAGSFDLVGIVVAVLQRTHGNHGAVRVGVTQPLAGPQQPTLGKNAAPEHATFPDRGRVGIDKTGLRARAGRRSLRRGSLRERGGGFSCSRRMLLLPTLRRCPAAPDVLQALEFLSRPLRCLHREETLGQGRCRAWRNSLHVPRLRQRRPRAPHDRVHLPVFPATVLGLDLGRQSVLHAILRLDLQGRGRTKLLLTQTTPESGQEQFTHNSGVRTRTTPESGQEL